MIENLPDAVKNAVQQGILARECHDALEPELSFDLFCNSQVHEGKVGDTKTETRAGLPATDDETSSALTPGADPSSISRTQEQFSYTMARFSKDTESFLPNDYVAAFSQYRRDAIVVAQSGKLTLNRMRRNAFLREYYVGDTYTTAAQGPGTSTALVVADASGFDKVLVNGTPVLVSGTNPGSLYLAGVLVTYTAVNLGTNTITLSVAATWAQYARVQRSDAPRIVRPATILAPTRRGITATDLPTLEMVRRASTFLKTRRVPGVKGTKMYALYLTPEWMNVLLADPEARNRLLSAEIPDDLKQNAIGSYGGAVFYEMDSVESKKVLQADVASLQTDVSTAIMIGDAPLEEYYIPQKEFADGADEGVGVDTPLHYKMPLDGKGVLTYVLRTPIDVLGDKVTHSWVSSVGYAVPTDAQSLSGVERAKRGVVLEAALPAS